MKRKFFLVVAILSILTLAGCADDDRMIGTLSSPTNIQAIQEQDKSLIIFDGVENAEYYEIYINDVSVTIKGANQSRIQFDASKIITLPQKYNIKVKACAKQYFDSVAVELMGGYTYTSVLSSPVVTLDGTTLNWNKVDNAQFYDVEVVSQSPTITNVYRVPTNTFDASSVLVGVGAYRFRVKAISENSDYLESGFSNLITIQQTQTLITPNGLEVNYSASLNEDVLTFVSSDSVDEFVFNVDNKQIKLNATSSNYLIKSNIDDSNVNKSDLANMYAIKLNSLLKDNDITATATKGIKISIRAISNTEYVFNSFFSSEVLYQYYEVLKTPTLQVQVNNGKVDIKITDNNEGCSLVGGYAIYLDDEKFKTISADIENITLPTETVGTKGIRVQAVSNNNNCYSSNLSEVKYATSPAESFNELGLEFGEGIISWTDVGAGKYLIEISNARYRTMISTSESSVDLSEYPSGKYSINLIATASGFKQKSSSTTIELRERLGLVSNVDVVTILGEPYIQFSAVENVYGYVLYRGDVMVNKVFTSTSICLTDYLAVASDLNISVRAITAVGNIANDDEITDSFVWQNITILPEPAVSIVGESGKYYLSIDVDEKYESLASGIAIWADYTLLSGENGRKYEDTRVDISSYLAVAGKHEFMVKALSNNGKTRDSRLVTITKTQTQQLNVVTGIAVTLDSNEDYILTFDEQTLAAEYQVRIEKAEDADFEEEFVIPCSYAVITQYIKEAGVYKVYVKAIARSLYYTDSVASGNPYNFSKGLTLPSVNNLSIVKSNGKILAGWDKVENCKGYKVNIYYQFGGQSRLITSIETMSTSINIGADKYKCVYKEGDYTIEVKPLGDGKTYETGKYATYTYQYKAETLSDFKRNTVTMFGESRDYFIETLDDLKYLLWYHYLYNDQVWNYNSALTYNLKVYCSKNLDTLAEGCGESVATQVGMADNNAEKMKIIATSLLEQCPFLSGYTLGLQGDAGTTQNFCLNEESNIYMFRYTDVLDEDGLNRADNQQVLFVGKVDAVEPFYQRADNYIFALDTCTTVVDVTTVEQLFLAVQYGAKPNFVGDCKVAKTVYENARQVLLQICDDGMTSYQKVLQIFNYLSNRVNYTDITVGEGTKEYQSASGQSLKMGELMDNYLSGALYDLQNQQASSLGLSKAFVLLCSLEGVDAIVVQGTVKDELKARASTTEVVPTKAHYWNKVYLNIENDGYNWYAIDIANSKLDVTFTSNDKTYQTASHKYFLVTDAYLNTYLGSQPVFTYKKSIEDYTGDYSANNTTFNYYKYQKYSAEYGKYNVGNANFKYEAENGGIDEQIKNMMMYAMLRANNRQVVTVDMDISEYVGVGDTASLLGKIVSDYYADVAINRLNRYYNCLVTTTISGNCLVISFIPSALEA